MRFYAILRNILGRLLGQPRTESVCALGGQDEGAHVGVKPSQNNGLTGGETFGVWSQRIYGVACRMLISR